MGLAVRLAVLDAPGHYGDAFVIGRWTDNLATYGPWSFYQHDGSIYPALLYAYWPIGVFLNGADQARAIKGLSIPFDLAVAVVLYVAASRFTGRGRALIAPALYLLNPAVLLAGPVWGQVDAAGTLVLLLALLALAGGRFGWAGALAMVAGMVKPQFGLVILPVAALAVMRWRATGSRAPVVRGLIGVVVAYAVVALPLRLDPITFVHQVIESGGFKQMSSANAANLWGLLQGYKIPDGALVYVGGALLLIGLAAVAAAAAQGAGPVDHPGGRPLRLLRLLLPADPRPRALPLPGDGGPGADGSRELARAGGVPAPGGRLRGLDALRAARHDHVHPVAVARRPRDATGGADLDLADPDRDRGDRCRTAAPATARGG